jgi:S-DNA-T family DNA segregation ATPase FtsK/SpoIIIE
MALFNVVKGDKDQNYIPAKVMTPGIRVPGWLYFAGLGIKTLCVLVYRLIVSVFRFAWITFPAAVFAYAGLMLDRWVLPTAAGITVVGLGLWWWKGRRSFTRVWLPVGWFYLAQWNRWFRYARLWKAMCVNLGLTSAFDGDRYYPRIIGARRDGEGDILTVQMLSGQHPADWVKAAARIAYTFDALACTVKAKRSRWSRSRSRVQLHLRMRDALARVLTPLPVPAVPDVSRVVIAIRSSGAKVAVSLRTHLLIAGASDAGKGSVLWAIVSALAAGIRDGLIQVYAFDPKQGMELAAGERLFHRFYDGDAASMAEGLEQIAREMVRRQKAKKGKARDHIATVDDPALVVLIDEFGALTSYVTDKKLKDRLAAAMSVILSQGRAVGVHVVAALQDPRKEILPFRNLFHARIGLRLNEESEVALILSDDALDRGAACHQIPASLPGVGYMIATEGGEPDRVRFPYHSDADIAELADAYGRPATGTEVVPVVPQQDSPNGVVVNR